MPNKRGQIWLVPRAANEPVDNAKRFTQSHQVPPACERGDHRDSINSLSACQLREALAVLNVDREGVKIDTVDRGADAALPNDRPPMPQRDLALTHESSLMQPDQSPPFRLVYAA